MFDGWLAWIVGVLGALLVLHSAASWMERRGWIYYRRAPERGHGAALSNALSEFEAVLNPAADHRIELDRSTHELVDEEWSEETK